jgi:predicted dehydrogenase
MAKQLQAIMVGCGAMSSEWIRSAKELGVRITSLVDVNPESARKQAAAFQLEALIFDNLSEAIERSPAQLLFDCTIPATHVDVDFEGLSHGLHVLEEKPLAPNLASAKQLVELAQKNGLAHVVVQNRRFNAGIRKVRRLLDRAFIGDLTSVNIDFFVPAHFGGFREKMDHVLLTDMAIHPFDAVRFITRANAQTVYCDEWNPKGSWWQHGAAANAIFQMDGGIRFSFRGSWCAEGLRTSWDGVWRITGTKGTIVWDGLDDIRGEYVKVPEGFFYEQQQIPVMEEPDPAETRGHFSVMTQFLRQVTEGIPAETRSLDNIHSLAMVLAAIESSNAGSMVPVRVLESN